MYNMQHVHFNCVANLYGFNTSLSCAVYCGLHVQHVHFNCVANLYGFNTFSPFCGHAYDFTDCDWHVKQLIELLIVQHSLHIVIVKRFQIAVLTCLCVYG